MTYKRIILIVLDSVGIGELPDAASYGDEGAHTLGHLAERVQDFELPQLRRLGLANIAPLGSWEAVDRPAAAYGKMAEQSTGKDTMTGHWELAGLRLTVPFRTFPEGFPAELLDAFEARTGRKVIGNKPASGTDILDELGERQLQTGEWIVYTSADSVFQLAAHEDKIPLDELYRACEVARELTLQEPYTLGRVIARPYVGEPGAFRRTANRHDYALNPPQPTVLDALRQKGLDVLAVGKINDIFNGQGISRTFPTASNAQGLDRTLSLMKEEFAGLLFTNLVDFDSLYGHRRNPQGYAAALQAFDQRVPALVSALGPDDLLILTADHGNDPYHPGTDHTREYVPLLVYSPALQRPAALGVRETFADVAATIADNFNLIYNGHGTSFLEKLDDGGH